MKKTITILILITAFHQFHIKTNKKCTINGFKNIHLPKNSKLQKFHFSNTKTEKIFDSINITALEICYFQCHDTKSKEICDLTFYRSMLNYCEKNENCKKIALANKNCLNHLNSEICLKEKDSCIQLRTRKAIKQFNSSKFENFEKNLCYLNNGKIGPCEKNGDIKPFCVKINKCDSDKKIFNLNFFDTTHVFPNLISNEFFSSKVIMMKLKMPSISNFFLAPIMGHGIGFQRDKYCQGHYFRFYDAEFKAYVPLSCNLGNYQ